MKKYKLIIILTIIPILGFGNEPPEQVLIKFLKAFYSNNHKKAYKYISKKDKKAISRKNFETQNNLDDPFRQEMAKMINSLSTYAVNETKTDADRAIIDITITAPDMPKVLADIFGPFYGPKSMENPQETMRYLLHQYLKKGNVPMAESKGKFALVKESGHWKIFLNLKNHL